MKLYLISLWLYSFRTVFIHFFSVSLSKKQGQRMSTRSDCHLRGEPVWVHDVQWLCATLVSVAARIKTFEGQAE